MAGMPWDMSTLLARKYAILQQEADATTKNAATNAVTGASAANVNDVRASLAPRESAANVAEAMARTRLTGEQANVVAPESRSRVRNMDAETGMINTRNKIETRESLTTLRDQFGRPIPPRVRSPLDGIFGTQFRQPRLQDYDPQTGRLSAAGLDYTNGYD